MSDQDRHEYDVMREQEKVIADPEYQRFLDEQDALPEHKRSGWCERMTEQADMMRKSRREDELLEREQND